MSFFCVQLSNQHGLCLNSSTLFQILIQYTSSACYCDFDTLYLILIIEDIISVSDRSCYWVI